MSSEDRIGYVVAGELWEQSLLTRTVLTLRRAQIEPRCFDLSRTWEHLEFGEVVDFLIRSSLHCRYVVVLAAGSTVVPGFASEMEAFLEQNEPALAGHLLYRAGERFPALHRQCFVVSSSAYRACSMPDYTASYGEIPDFEVSAENVHHDYTPLWVKRAAELTKGGSLTESQNLLACFIRAGHQVINLPDPVRRAKSYLYHHSASRPKQVRQEHLAPARKMLYRINRGMESFQEIEQRVKDPVDLEEKLQVYAPQELQSINEGKVFGYNAETVQPEGVAENDVDTVVTVASGIKPFLFASHLGTALKNLVFLDLNPAQLAFAHFAMSNLESASSWKEIVEQCPLTNRSEPVNCSAADHEQVLAAVRSQGLSSGASVHFVRADLLGQTFRLISFLKSLGTQRVLVWYSNIFGVTLRDYIERLPGLELSFQNLFLSHFSFAEMYGDGPAPKCYTRSLSDF